MPNDEIAVKDYFDAFKNNMLYGLLILSKLGVKSPIFIGDEVKESCNLCGRKQQRLVGAAGRCCLESGYIS